MKVYILKVTHVLSGKVEIRSVHTTKEGCNAALEEYIDIYLSKNDYEIKNRQLNKVVIAKRRKEDDTEIPEDPDKSFKRLRLIMEIVEMEYPWTDI